MKVGYILLEVIEIDESQSFSNRIDEQVDYFWPNMTMNYEKIDSFPLKSVEIHENDRFSRKFIKKK